jgi:hypothetical protein
LKQRDIKSTHGKKKKKKGKKKKRSMAGGQALDMDLDDPNQFQTSELDNDAYENESYGNEE